MANPPLAVGDAMTTAQIWEACAALVAVCLVGLVFALWARKRLLGKNFGGNSSGFTLGELRKLQKTGKMSNEEFEKAKSMVVAAARREMAVNDLPPQNSSPPSPPPRRAPGNNPPRRPGDGGDNTNSDR